MLIMRLGTSNPTNHDAQMALLREIRDGGVETNNSSHEDQEPSKVRTTQLF